MIQHQPRAGDVKNSEQRCSCHDVPLVLVDDEWVCSIDSAAREQLDEARRELLDEIDS